MSLCSSTVDQSHPREIGYSPVPEQPAGLGLSRSFCTRPVPTNGRRHRSLLILRRAKWPHSTHPQILLQSLIFDIGGNKFRLVARVDFEEQVLYLQSVLTHGEYNREDF